MAEEDSHSTDLTVSGEEGHFIGSLHFGLQLRTKLFSNAGYTAKLHKNA